MNEPINKKDAYILTLNCVIKHLTEVRDKINDDNVHLFTMEESQSRKLDPLQQIGNPIPIGHKQTGPDVLDFHLENWTNVGKEFLV